MATHEDHRNDALTGSSKERRRYHKYTEEFKREAVRLSQLPDRTVAGTARSLGIDTNTLGLWRKQFGVSVSTTSGALTLPAKTSEAWISEQSREIEELRRRLSEAEQERDILKKAVGVISRVPR